MNLRLYSMEESILMLVNNPFPLYQSVQDRLYNTNKTEGLSTTKDDSFTNTTSGLGGSPRLLISTWCLINLGYCPHNTPLATYLSLNNTAGKIVLEDLPPSHTLLCLKVTHTHIYHWVELNTCQRAKGAGECNPPSYQKERETRYE